MSGGAFNYEYYRFKDTYSGVTHDTLLDQLIEDLADVLHDLEWYESADYSYGEYIETLEKFKNKWIKDDFLKNEQHQIKED